MNAPVRNLEYHLKPWIVSDSFILTADEPVRRTVTDLTCWRKTFGTNDEKDAVVLLLDPRYVFQDVEEYLYRFLDEQTGDHQWNEIYGDSTDVSWMDEALGDNDPLMAYQHEVETALLGHRVSDDDEDWLIDEDDPDAVSNNDVAIIQERISNNASTPIIRNGESLILSQDIEILGGLNGSDQDELLNQSMPDDESV